jgi:hypothetical protein
MIIASLESFLGSLWFAALCLAAGFIVGHLGLLNRWLKK